ncbi:MAG: hypothetical protein A2148_00485 [Chloroflexi bacterium RBG_16_68_14]|nr:MAG: hypothetical protein A2148_00485 [Chloroflexi bacterium RBG_16_68_14]
MAGDDTKNKFVDALNEGSDAMIDAVRAANDRAHRFSTALIEQAQEGQREAVDLAQKWMAAPFDLLSLYGAFIETSTKVQHRALDATRQWFGELSDAQKETRDVLQRVISANRHAGEATVELARELFSRSIEAAQPAGDGNGRKPARETAKSPEPSTSES